MIARDECDVGYQFNFFWGRWLVAAHALLACLYCSCYYRCCCYCYRLCCFRAAATAGGWGGWGVWNAEWDGKGWTWMEMGSGTPAKQKAN